MVNEEKLGKNRQKNAYFDFKRISNLQYENQLFKAREVLRKINKFPEMASLLFEDKPSLSKDSVREKV